MRGTAAHKGFMTNETTPIRKGQRPGQPQGDGNTGSWASADPNNDADDDMLDTSPVDEDRRAAVLEHGSVWSDNLTEPSVDEVLPDVSYVEIRANAAGTGFDATAAFSDVDMVEFACTANGWDRYEGADDEDGVDDEGLTVNEVKASAWLDANNESINAFWAEHGIEDDTAMLQTAGRLTIRVPLDDNAVTFAGAAEALRESPALDLVTRGLSERDSDMTRGLIARINAGHS